MKLPPGLVCPILGVVYRLWTATLRIESVGRGPFDRLVAEGRPAILALWHGELFPVTSMRGNLKLCTLVSQSRDGEYIDRVLRSIGFHTVRGSSTRGGGAALKSLVRAMRDEGYIPCITLDGPRGPRHRVKPGTIFMAHHAGAAIVPLRAYMKRAHAFKSWDRFRLPMPFSKVRAIFGEPYYLHGADKAGQLPGESGAHLDSESLHEHVRKLEETMRSLLPNPPCPPVPPETPAPSANSKAEPRPNPLLYLFLRRVSRLMGRLGYGGINALAGVLGFCMWRFIPSRRKMATQAVAERLGLGRDEAERLARRSFTENARSFLEIFLAPSFTVHNNPRLAPFDENALAFLAEKDAMVATTAHLGAWELLAGILGDAFPDRPRQVVVRRHKNPAVNACIADLRGGTGVEMVNHRGASAKVLPTLKKSGVSSFLVDHNTSRAEAVFLPFLGKTAAVNSGPALLALRAKAKVYPVFLIRGSDGLYHMHSGKALDTATLKGSIAERTKEIAAYYTAAVEEQVRLHPEQWFWMHKRWKTRPPGEDA